MPSKPRNLQACKGAERGVVLFQKNKKDSENQAGESGYVVPLNVFALEEEHNDDGEDRKGNNFLNDLKLKKVEGTAVSYEAYAVRRYRKAILEKRDSPGKQNYQDERPAGRDFHLAELEVSVPGKRHKHV